MVQDPGKSTAGLPAAKQEPAKDAPGKPAPTQVAPSQPAPTHPVSTTPAKGTVIGKGTVTEPGRTGQEATPVPSKEEPPQPTLPVQTPPPAAPGAAVQPPAPGQFTFGTILIPALWLIGILIVGALILAWLRRSRQGTELAATTTATDQLATFRHAYEDGELTTEEFKKVKARLTEKLRERDPMSMPPQVRPKRADETASSPGEESA